MLIKTLNVVRVLFVRAKDMMSVSIAKVRSIRRPRPIVLMSSPGGGRILIMVHLSSIVVDLLISLVTVCAWTLLLQELST